MKSIKIFTDGSANNKSKKIGGIGIYYHDNLISPISKKILASDIYLITNQTMELLAAITGITNLIETFDCSNKHIYLYTDSKYLINSITIWFETWKKNKWKTSTGKDIKNLNLIKKLYYLSKILKIKFFHVRAHKKKPTDPQKYDLWYGNYQADILAQNARIKHE